MRFPTLLGVSLVLCCVSFAVGQPRGFNYDEAKVPKFDLTDPLVCQDGTEVGDVETWLQKRRPEILELFKQEVYGRSPEKPLTSRYKVLEEGDAYDGLATRKQVRVYFHPEKEQPSVDVLLYLPKDNDGPVATFLGLNFRGNHTTTDDKQVLVTESWVRNGGGVTDHKASAAGRGGSASRWAIQTILKRGYGIATAYYGDIDPDYHDEFKNGIHSLFPPEGGKIAGDDWGSIAGWAWGLSRIADYLEKDKGVDASRLALLGHSRLGKTSLWAGAIDERFQIVISNNSGCGGAALSKRRFGETVKRINTSFPHWFNDNFNKYNDAESSLPLDQHLLLALIAPRHAYVASAEGDRWADPRGEFLSLKHAAPVFQLLGASDAKMQAMPKVNEPVGGHIGYHIRSGKHDVTDYDWARYLDFADRHLKTQN